jgi:hypothetical protein
MQITDGAAFIQIQLNRLEQYAKITDEKLVCAARYSPFLTFILLAFMVSWADAHVSCAEAG